MLIVIEPVIKAPLFNSTIIIYVPFSLIVYLKLVEVVIVLSGKIIDLTLELITVISSVILSLVIALLDGTILIYSSIPPYVGVIVELSSFDKTFTILEILVSYPLEFLTVYFTSYNPGTPFFTSFFIETFFVIFPSTLSVAE